ncbi:MAG: 50S ribosomal protein L10 [Oscillospiraceae bacterium]|jgi:ribosomal protein L10|nr:MAG: 50S ribosomal protein L10 [Oscillospiraceae bacterium]
MSEAAISAKSEIVSQIKDKLSRAKSVVIVDYRGLTVSEVTELRNNMRAAGVEYKVLKNTMMSRACEELGITGVEEHLSGPSAFCFGYDDPVSAPKIMKEFAEKVNKTEIKGGIMDNAAIDNKVVEKLASTPSKEVLLTRLMWSITGSVRSLAIGLNAVKEKMEA